MKSLLVAILFLGSTACFAEQFLGVEKGSASTSPQKSASEPAVSQSSSGHWGGSGAMWLAEDNFNVHLTLHYYINKYFGIDTTGKYSHFVSSENKGQMFGPESYFVVRLTNPTIATPLLAAGLGYDRWRRFYNDELFSDSGSVTALGYVGMNVSLTKRFGLSVLRRQKIYLADPPHSFADRTSDEPHSRIRNEVGFVLVF